MTMRNSLRWPEAVWPEPAFLDVKGTRRDDRLRGTPGADVFDIRQGGNDTVTAGAGDDRIIVGSALSGRDRIDGGVGTDALLIDGRYERIVFRPETLRNVEVVQLGGDRRYALILSDGNLAAGQTLAVLGGSVRSVSIDGSAEKSGTLLLSGTDGSDVLIGGGGNDTLFHGGGSDVLKGGGGYDRADFTIADVADVSIDLRLAIRQTFGTRQVQLTGVEDLLGGLGDDTLVGDAESNWLSGGGLGDDELYGMGGDDLLTIGSSIDPQVRYNVNGGSGVDTLDFSDLVYGGISLDLGTDGEIDTRFGYLTVASVERFQGSDGDDYFSLDDGDTVAFGRGGNDRILGRGGDDVLYGDKTIERSAGGASPFVIAEDAVGGRDILNGGDGDDVLVGGRGADIFTGEGGRDRFVYEKAADSLTAAPDTIYEYETGDRIDLRALDANPYKAGNQAFHVGATKAHIGDVVIAYDAARPHRHAEESHG